MSVGVDISYIRRGLSLNFGQQLALAAKLAVPAILAQLSTIIMQYIDASMVGSLGADGSASVGLMNSSLWLFWGVCSTVTMGFSVQVAHCLGANNEDKARDVLRQGLTACLGFGFFAAFVGGIIAPFLPGWLGGDPAIQKGASIYFGTFVAAMPLLTLNYLCGGMLRCAGNMKIPGLLNVIMCVLDVAFNFLLIFPTRELSFAGMRFMCPGAGLGVLGAALGTVLAEAFCAGTMLWYLWRIQPELRLRGQHNPLRAFRPTREIIRKASKIAVPMTLQQAVFSGAQIAVTMIVAPLGTVAIAANAFAVTAESLCYMPGFGIGDAATTLAGQCYGAGRFGLVRRFTYVSVFLGMAVMAVMGAVMYVCAPLMMGIMSPVTAIVDLGTEVLRIEAWAEPLYAASIVAYGAFVGVGDTTVAAIMNFGSIWLVRIPLAWKLSSFMGLKGVWVAMCIELSFRGIIFLCRMFGRSWLKPGRLEENAAEFDKISGEEEI